MSDTQSGEGAEPQVEQLEEKVSTLRINSSLTASERLSKMVEQVAEIARRMFNAAGSAVLLLDKKEGALIFKFATGDVNKQLKGMRIGTQRGISGWVATHCEPLIVNDVSKEPRFDKIVDKATGFTTKSVMCAPLVEGGNTVGVIEVVNKRDGTDFKDEDLETLMLIAYLAVLPICFFKEEEARNQLVSLAVKSRLVPVRKKAIDALSGYGFAAIPDILNIVNHSITQTVRTYGLAKIEEITKESEK